jgi:hypothetical protein
MHWDIFDRILAEKIFNCEENRLIGSFIVNNNECQYINSSSQNYKYTEIALKTKTENAPDKTRKSRPDGSFSIKDKNSIPSFLCFLSLKFCFFEKKEGEA